MDFPQSDSNSFNTYNTYNNHNTYNYNYNYNNSIFQPFGALSDRSNTLDQGEYQSHSPTVDPYSTSGTENDFVCSRIRMLPQAHQVTQNELTNI